MASEIVDMLTHSDTLITQFFTHLSAHRASATSDLELMLELIQAIALALGHCLAEDEAPSESNPHSLSLGVACSGGADSMTLGASVVLLERLQRSFTHFESEIKRLLGDQFKGEIADRLESIGHLLTQRDRLPLLKTTLLTVDHGLFERSSEQAARVSEVWRAHSVDSLILNADPQLIKRGAGVEDGARSARYHALDMIADQRGLRYVLLGHHAQDQAETLLMRLATSAGLSGMGGIPKRRGRYLRPWLEIPPHLILRARNILALPVFIDPTNEDLRFTRNAVRHKISPAFDDVFGARWLKGVSHTASHIRGDERALTYLINDLLNDHLKVSSKLGRVSLNWLSGLMKPPEVARAGLRHTYQTALYTLAPSHADRRRSRAQLGLIEEVWRGRENQQRSLPLGLIVWGARGKLEIVAPALMPTLPRERFIDLPERDRERAELSVPWGEWTLKLTPLITSPLSGEAESIGRSRGAYLRRAGGMLRLALPLEGARYKPSGANGSKRVKRLWGDRRVPLFERARLPVLSDQEGRVLWSPYCRPADWICEPPTAEEDPPLIAWDISWTLSEE